MSMNSILQQINNVRKFFVKYVNEAGGNVPQTASMMRCAQQFINVKPLPTVAGQFYKCASVDTQTMTWTGYKAVESRVGTAFQDYQTTGLIYTQNLIPQVDKVYSKNCTYMIAGYWDVLQGQTLAVAVQKVQHDQQSSTLSIQTLEASYNEQTNTVNITTD